MADLRRPPFTPPVAPAGWDVLSQPPPTTVWAAVAADDDHPGRFRANLVLTCDDLRGLSFRDWQASTDELLRRSLADYVLVDLERRPVGGRPGGRRLAHHVDREGRALTMEQWFTRHDDRGWTLTATVDTWSYDALADLLAGVADDWHPVAGGGADAD